MKTIVLDSFAILAYLQNEDGAQKVEELLLAAQAGKIRLLINRINLGEVFYLSAKRKGLETARQILKEFSLLPVEIISPSDDLIDQAAQLKAQYPISYADGFVAATAFEFQAEIISGDKDFQYLEKLLKIIWL
ncbi:MAG: type II toxin-antitoxin system VapC family toxin [Candidatus Schekmanbacteria bacterium]|nr:type II toxin-antitoxin system VapC family toxin [Candidatus Schekmanbacteria bacterium]